jgi:hypothetical protein
MITQSMGLDVPRYAQIVNVQTTSHRGSSPEEVASRCASKLISVSRDAHPAIREQAEAFKGSIEKLLAHYMREAIASDRTTVYNALKDAGHPELAELIRRI